MKLYIRALIICLVTSNVWGATTADPTREYLESVVSQNGYLDRFLSDDKLYRMDVDLDGNGSPEVLLSLGRHSLSQEGNTWTVYKVTGGIAERVGEAVFSPQRFYLGRIDEINLYGIVSFAPAGGGPGTFYGYTFDGRTITKTEIGTIRRDTTTSELKGKELEEKYMGEKADGSHEMVSTIPAAEFGPKYKLEISPMKIADYVESHLAPSTVVGATQKATAVKASGAGNTMQATSSAPAASGSESTSVWSKKAPLWIVISLLSFGALILIIKLLRKPK